MGYTRDKFLKHNPKNPKWLNIPLRVVSGPWLHAVYALLHLTGYDSVTIDDIKTFRQWAQDTRPPRNLETPSVSLALWALVFQMRSAWQSLNPIWRPNSTSPMPRLWITTPMW